MSGRIFAVYLRLVDSIAGVESACQHNDGHRGSGVAFRNGGGEGWWSTRCIIGGIDDAEGK